MSDSNELTQPGTDTGRPRIVVGVKDAPSAEVAIRWAEVEGRSVVPRVHATMAAGSPWPPTRSAGPARRSTPRPCSRAP